MSLPKTVLLCGGSPNRTTDLYSMSFFVDALIAVDSGADAFFEEGITPHAFVGDADSVSTEALEKIKKDDDCLKILYPSEKDDTDLSLAFECAREKFGAESIVLTNVSGGRIDHALGVLGTIKKNKDLMVIIQEDDYKAFLISDSNNFDFELADRGIHKGEVFSVIPLEDNTVISETGCKWSVDNLMLDSLSDRGLSNVMTSDDAHVWCSFGSALVIFPFE